MAVPVAPAAAGESSRLDGDRPGRAGRVCPLAVAAAHPRGLAAVVAPPPGGPLSAGRGPLLAALAARCAPAGDAWAWHGPGRSPHPGARPVAGARGRGGPSPLADPDGAGPGRP